MGSSGWLGSNRLRSKHMSGISKTVDVAAPIRGILTDCHTNNEVEIKLLYRIDDGIFQLLGGPTGYESFRIDSNFEVFEDLCIMGWCACMGTKPVYNKVGYLIAPGWDKLVIPGPEMRKALNDYIYNGGA